MLKTPKQNRIKVIAIAAALVCSPLMANAAGLGRITVLSALGQPLKAELEITANKDELNSLAARLASPEAFKVAGIEFVSALSNLHFSREVKERNGKRYVEITTDRPVNEPFIDMLVELNWASGRLVREYTFLLDPPELIQKAAPAPVAAPEVKAPVPVARVEQATESPRVITQIPRQPERIAAPADAPSMPAPALRKSTSLPTPVVTAEASATREVKTGDTLGKIATETRPEGVSLDQMLVALFRSNADAFDGNMSRMRAGKILNIPDADTVRAIDASEARREVVAQAADFNAYRRKLAEVAAKSDVSAESGGRAAAGKIAPKVEDKVPAVAAGKDKLEVSRTETVAPKPDAKGAGKGEPVQGKLSALEEDLVSRERALREAGSRIAQLEKNLGDLKKLAEMKSEAGTAMQKQAEAAKSSTPAATPAAKPVEPMPKAVEPAQAPPAASAPVAEPAKAVPPPAADVPATPPPPKKKVVPLPEPEPEPDFIEENGPLVFGGAGIIALLLGYLGFSAYRRKKKTVEDVAPVSQVDLSTNSVFSETSSESINVSAVAPGEFSITESAPESEGEAVDPLVEADTYLAFGRDAQAEEILLDALQKEPARHAIHLKLLEIYAARRSPMQFNTLARELRDQTGGVGSEWERAMVMGLALDPNNSLYQVAEGTVVVDAPAAAPVAEPMAIDPEATMVFTAPPATEEPPPVATDEVASLDFDLDLGEVSEPSAAAGGDAAVASAESGGLDFDLDLGEPQPEEAAPAAVAETSDHALALDIDFDLDTPAAEPPGEAAIAVPAVEVSPVAEIEPAADDAMGLSIDFEMPAPAPEVAEAVAQPLETAAADGNSIDFSLDLELPSVGESSPAESAPVSMEVPSIPDAGNVEVAPVSESDDSSIDFDFDLGDDAPSLPPAAESTPPELDLSSISLDLDTPAATPQPTEATLDLELPDLGDAATEAVSEPEVIEDNPEAATKLELALAYEEMGDREGARELLEEVLKEGSPAQRGAAQAKLESLG